MIQKFTKVLFIIAVLIGNSVEAKTCSTKEDYLNKMLLVGVYLEDKRDEILNLSEIRTKENLKKAKILNHQMTKFLHDQKKISELFNKNRNSYARACKILDSMVKKYNIDLKENAKKTITIQDLGKRKGMCNPAEAGTLTMLFSMEARTRTNGKFMTSAEGKKFMNAASREMLTNPGKTCAEIKRLSPKYGISFDDLLKKNKALMKRRPPEAH